MWIRRFSRHDKNRCSNLGFVKSFRKRTDAVLPVPARSSGMRRRRGRAPATLVPGASKGCHHAPATARFLNQNTRRPNMRCSRLEDAPTSIVWWGFTKVPDAGAERRNQPPAFGAPWPPLMGAAWFVCAPGDDVMDRQDLVLVPGRRQVAVWKMPSFGELFVQKVPAHVRVGFHRRFLFDGRRFRRFGLADEHQSGTGPARQVSWTGCRFQRPVPAR